jgi:thioredoxin reductase (NADPH)
MAKPVILAVDDDPEVLNAVERDLRQHFRADYRVMKVGSGAEALDTTRQLKQRGSMIALFLVDERMPEMTGTQFLVEAIKLYPEARKVLLTAYADTETAITAINDIGLDQYLLKPWEPPSERLFPVLDDLLMDWVARTRPPFDGMRIAGTTLSSSSYALKDFLSGNQVPYQWVDLEEDAPMRELVSAMPEGMQRLPVVFFPDGTSMVQPTPRELAARIGMQTQAQRPFYDLVVVGGGPAGLAGAVYGASEGLRTILVERYATGGQAGTSSQIENYLGFPTGVSGADLARRATMQAKRFGAEILTAQDVVEIKRNDPYRTVRLSDGSELSCYAVMIASGMEVRRLEVPGVEELVGAGVFYGAALTEAAGLPRSRRIRDRRRQFGRTGRDVFFAARAQRDDAHPWGGSQRGHVAVSRRANRRNEKRASAAQFGRDGCDRRRTARVDHGREPADGRADRVSRRGDVHLHRHSASDGDGRCAGRARCPGIHSHGTRPHDRRTAAPRVAARARSIPVRNERAGCLRRGRCTERARGKRVASAVGEGSATVSMIHKYLETV